MLYFIALGFLLLILGIIFYIPRIQIGGAPAPAPAPSPSPYLAPTKIKLKKMFDHQLSYKTKNGSWLSVSFKNMKRFNKDGIWNTLKTSLNDKEAGQLYPQTYMLPTDLKKVMILDPKNSFILNELGNGCCSIYNFNWINYKHITQNTISFFSYFDYFLIK